MFRRVLSGTILFAACCVTAQAALLSRAGGQAYYDTTTNLTWVADANLAQTLGYDADGLMTWSAANAFVAALNAQNGGQGYLGVNDWRLPTVTDTGTPGCNFAFSATDCGYNVDLSTGELANMYYATLGNSGYYLSNGNFAPCSAQLSCLSNSGPFSNLQSSTYWTGTTDATNANAAWYFSFSGGAQGGGHTKTFAGDYAWVVHSGDMPAVPVPAAAWLFGGGLGALSWIRRRQART